MRPVLVSSQAPLSWLSALEGSRRLNHRTLGRFECNGACRAAAPYGLLHCAEDVAEAGRMTGIYVGGGDGPAGQREALRIVDESGQGGAIFLGVGSQNARRPEREARFSRGFVFASCSTVIATPVPPIRSQPRQRTVRARPGISRPQSRH